MTENKTQSDQNSESNSRGVPFFRPSLGQAEIDGATNAMRSNWLTTGPRTKQFEQEFASAVGAKHAVAVNSATAAMHLALVAKEIGDGDEVVIPTMTFASAAEVVLAVGATPIFVDSDPETLRIDLKGVGQAISARTRAVMPMHYGGAPLDLAPFRELIQTRPEISLIDDAAHAFPAVIDGERIGSTADASCFSFYANKTITTGEGGMLTTDDEELAERVRSLSLHGLSKNAWSRFETRSAWDYDIARAGWKCNLTDIASAIGLAQLETSEEMAHSRREITRHYDSCFLEFVGVSPIGLDHRMGSSAHLYVIRIDKTQTRTGRDGLIDSLQKLDIGTSVHYRPLHMHSFYKQIYKLEADLFPVAAQAFGEIVSLPLFPDMTEGDTELVVESVKKVLYAKASI